MRVAGETIRTVLGALLLVAVIAIAYAPAFHGGFIFDDNVFLTNNPLVHAPDGLRRMWFTREAMDYWPVTSSSLWLEWRMWGASAPGYHATNLALHAIDVLLFWAVLRRLRVPGAFLGAMLFAIHPVNAETVVWITERKNLLAMLFFLMSIWFFLLAEERGGRPAPTLRHDRDPRPPNALAKVASRGVIPGAVGSRVPRVAWGDAPAPPQHSQSPGGAEGARGGGYYFLSLVCFGLAMLSKGSVVFLPLVLLGLVVWRRRLTRRDGGWLGAFVVMAVGLAVVEARFSTVESIVVGPGSGIRAQLAAAGAEVWRYWGMAIWPGRLMFAYPEWHVQPNDLSWWLPLVAAIGVTAALLWLALRAERARGLWKAALAVWLYFGLALAPALGFARVGFMKFTPVSGHYEHLALLGVTAAIGAAWGYAWERKRSYELLATAAVAAVVLLGLVTWRQATIYSDAQTLYLDTLVNNPKSWMADANLGALWLAEGRTAAAMTRFRTALELHPDYPEADNNLGLALSHEGRLPEAIERYHAALRLRPNFYQAENNLGVALAKSGRLAEAVQHFERALALQPDYNEARSNLERARKLGG